ncbi:hypothetical protein BDP81DRAFT_419210 [Colletotrichum phormii]|uniref:Secreted protein n=1 Tax=Colletotrichum phormii TaxID=359342 RepID=A0AAI9ZYB1_9PEZI|nr:uncharacterized protein BDP81DRAFT_419210 [Colletotrichum phormii]KAK1640020.1 hypothetical protein BDP81DRAFT_419210 [Colletotrichum phormii]
MTKTMREPRRISWMLLLVELRVILSDELKEDEMLVIEAIAEVVVLEAVGGSTASTKLRLAPESESWSAGRRVAGRQQRKPRPSRRRPARSNPWSTMQGSAS